MRFLRAAYDVWDERLAPIVDWYFDDTYCWLIVSLICGVILLIAGTVAPLGLTLVAVVGAVTFVVGSIYVTS